MSESWEDQQLSVTQELRKLLTLKYQVQVVDMKKQEYGNSLIPDGDKFMSIEVLLQSQHNLTLQ